MSTGNTTKVEAVTYRLSELDKLRDRINELRFAAETREYETALKAYNRRRRGRKEIQQKDKGTGFEIKRMGRTEFVQRPSKPNRILWHWAFSLGRGYKSDECGLLAHGGRHNRPISEKRVREYIDTMCRCQWQDNLIDPIAVTPNGEVINGQHRLAAMHMLGGLVHKPKLDKDWQFLVLFGVPADQVTLSDLSRRSAKDFTVIAGKAVAA